MKVNSNMKIDSTMINEEDIPDLLRYSKESKLSALLKIVGLPVAIGLAVITIAFAIVGNYSAVAIIGSTSLAITSTYGISSASDLKLYKKFLVASYEKVTNNKNHSNNVEELKEILFKKLNNKNIELPKLEEQDFKQNKNEDNTKQL